VKELDLCWSFSPSLGRHSHGAPEGSTGRSRLTAPGKSGACAAPHPSPIPLSLKQNNARKIFGHIPSLPQN